MSEQQEPDYYIGDESPVSGVVHIFDAEHINGRTGCTPSLCGAIGSYGPFKPERDAGDADLCDNCKRVQRQRESDANKRETENSDQ